MIIHRLYCTKCKVKDVPLIKYSRIKYKNKVFQYYYCRDCSKKRMREYVKTPIGRIKVRTAIFVSTKRYPKKRNARALLNYHVKKGEIVKPSNCSVCGEHENIYGHHPDYLKPLEVLWVCRGCHADIHRELKLQALAK